LFRVQEGLTLDAVRSQPGNGEGLVRFLDIDRQRISMAGQQNSQRITRFEQPGVTRLGSEQEPRR
jgi:hypothetical protein